MNPKRAAMPLTTPKAKPRFRFCIVPATLFFCFGVLTLALSLMLMFRALELGAGENLIYLGKGLVVVFHGVVCLLSSAASMRREVSLAFFAVSISTLFTVMAFAYAL